MHIICGVSTRPSHDVSDLSDLSDHLRAASHGDPDPKGWEFHQNGGISPEIKKWWIFHGELFDRQIRRRCPCQRSCSKCSPSWKNAPAAVDVDVLDGKIMGK